MTLDGQQVVGCCTQDRCLKVHRSSRFLRVCYLSAVTYIMIKCMHNYCFYQTETIVKYSDLIEQCSSESQLQVFLSDGDPTLITIRVPQNLKDAVQRLHTFGALAFQRSLGIASSMSC